MDICEKLFDSRPESGISETEEKVYDFLDGIGATYAGVRHNATATIEECHNIERITGAPTYKNIFLCNRTATDFYLLIMPGDKPFKTKLLSSQLGVSRLSFASAENAEKFLNTLPGSLSVLSLLFDTEKKVRLLIDNDINQLGFVGFHPCNNTTTLRFSVKELLDKIIPALGHEPTFVDLTLPEE